MPTSLRRVDQQRAGRGLYGLSVDREVYQISHCLTPPPFRARARTGTVVRSAALRTPARNFSTNDIVGIAAASPSAQKVRPSMFFATSYDQVDVALRARRRRGNASASSSATSCLRGRGCTSRSFRARRNA